MSDEFPYKAGGILAHKFHRRARYCYCLVVLVKDPLEVLRTSPSKTPFHYLSVQIANTAEFGVANISENFEVYYVTHIS